MSKLSQIVALIIGTVLLLCACNKGGQQDSTQLLEDTQGGSTADAQQLLDLETYSLKVQDGSDDSPGFQWRYIAGSEQGYYYWNDYGKVLFYDVSSGLSVPLCNRPDCSHTGKDCNAYFEMILSGGADDVDDTFEIGYIQFADGYLYLIGVDKAGYVSLYKVAADGSTREECMRLYKADFSDPSGDPSRKEFRSPEACIHRGYIYWIDSTATPLCIHRMKLGGKKDEVIYTEEGDKANTYRLEGYGDFVFFQTGHFVDEGYNMEGGIYAYNIQTGEIRLVLDGAISCYTINGEQIFYGTEKGISMYDLTTGKSEAIVETELPYPSMSVDERYLYYFEDEQGRLVVYRHDGTQVAEIVDEEASDCEFGDSRCIFSLYGSSEGIDDASRSGWAILFIDDIESGNAKWTELAGS